MCISSTRVMVVGFTSSGKTTYMAGMYDYMSLGANGFTLIARPADDAYLSKIWDDIYCGGNDRKWPAASDQIKEYSFTLAYNFEKILQFSWLDYPGGELFARSEQFCENLRSSSALIFLINGEHFRADESLSEVEYKRRVLYNLRKERKAINGISDALKALPPVMFVVSKSDLIKDCHVEYVGDIIREAFPHIFKRAASGTERLVAIEAMTLGEGVEKGEDLDPVNIENPVVFSLLWHLKQKVEELKMKIRDIQTEIADSDRTVANCSGNRVVAWLNSDRLRMARGRAAQLRQQALSLRESVLKLSNGIRPMLKVFRDGKMIYINDTEVPLLRYFDNVLSGI